MIGTGNSGDAAGSNGFAEQFQGFNAASPIAVPLTRTVKVTSIEAARVGEQTSGAAEPTDNTTGAAMLAALLFGVTGAAPTALPIKLRFTVDSLPPVKTTDGTETPAEKALLLPGVIGAHGIGTQLEVAATQAQQMSAPLRERLQPQATAEAPSTVSPPTVPAEAGSEGTELAFAVRLKPGPAMQTNSAASPPSREAIPRITAVATQFEVAATQSQQTSTALRERVQPQATAEAPPTVPLPTVPAEADSESTDLAFATRPKPDAVTQTNSPASPTSGEAIPRIAAVATQLAVAATQSQQMSAALRERVQPQATAETPSTVRLPTVPAEAGSESTDLAFADRLKPGPATQPNSPASPTSGEAIPRITAIAELRRSELDDGRTQNTVLPPALQMANPAAQTFITSDGPIPLVPADKPSTPAASETRAIAPEAAPGKSTEPLKELSLQVGNQNQERVEVRMVERGGELHVAVRTGNTDLAHGLREGITDLVSRLQETGFRTDTWRPVHAAASVSAASSPQQSATQFRNHSDSQSNPGWSQQQPRDQRDQHQSNRPNWVEELEGSLTPTGEPLPGDKYGFIR